MVTTFRSAISHVAGARTNATNHLNVSRELAPTQHRHNATRAQTGQRTQTGQTRNDRTDKRDRTKRKHARASEAKRWQRPGPSQKENADENQRKARERQGPGATERREKETKASKKHVKPLPNVGVHANLQNRRFWSAFPNRFSMVLTQGEERVENECATLRL